MKIWRINLQTKTHHIADTPNPWHHLGGRGLLAKIMLDEVDPNCDPLGPNNKLIFAPGLMVGHRLSSLDRISIGGKSPLTGGIKEANAGGRTGYHLTQLGIKALIYEREFNRRAGFTKADDRLPEWMTREPLPPHNTVFDVPEEDLDSLFDFDTEHD